MDKENVLNVHSAALFGHIKGQKYVICRKMDGTGEHVKRNKPDFGKTNVTCFLSYEESRFKKQKT
jgi:hypothetical protein